MEDKSENKLTLESCIINKERTFKIGPVLTLGCQRDAIDNKVKGREKKFFNLIEIVTKYAANNAVK